MGIIDFATAAALLAVGGAFFRLNECVVFLIGTSKLMEIEQQRARKFGFGGDVEIIRKIVNGMLEHSFSLSRLNKLIVRLFFALPQRSSVVMNVNLFYHFAIYIFSSVFLMPFRNLHTRGERVRDEGALLRKRKKSAQGERGEEGN